MSEPSHEIIFDAVPPDEVVFSPDRVQDLFNYLNVKLQRTGVPHPFENEGSLTDEEVTGLVSLFALTSDDKRPIVTGEIPGTDKKRIETREEYVARTLLIPMLTFKSTGPGSHKSEHRRLRQQAIQYYREQMSAQWHSEVSKFASAEYIGFIGGVSRILAERIKTKKFITKPVEAGATPNAASDPKVVPAESVQGRVQSLAKPREQVQWVLKPDKPGMPEKVKIVRDIFEAAGLDREEAAKIRQMISGSQTTVNLHAATARALEKLRGVCYAAAATKQLQMTPGEVKRIQAMLSINNPESLHDQIYESQRNGDLNARIIENELLSGLRKIVDVYTQSRKTNPAQESAADVN